MPQPIYAIGDIHGQLGLLDHALSKIEADGGADARIIFLGDYVDRGPDSKGVIERLVQGKAEGRNWVFLKGNHDRLMEWFLQDPPRTDPTLLVGFHWFHEKLGGIQTVESYGIPWPDQIRQFALAEQFRPLVPRSHVNFLETLALSHSEGPLFFAHAGIRPGIPLMEQSEEDLLWIRQEFHNDKSDHGKLIIHGHTPVKAATHYVNRVNLDSGAGYGQPLSTAVFEGRDAWLLTDQGRQPLVPA